MTNFIITLVIKNFFRKFVGIDKKNSDPDIDSELEAKTGIALYLNLLIFF
jgi:hypothetical protein